MKAGLISSRINVSDGSATFSIRNRSTYSLVCTLRRCRRCEGKEGVRSEFYSTLKLKSSCSKGNSFSQKQPQTDKSKLLGLSLSSPIGVPYYSSRSKGQVVSNGELVVTNSNIELANNKQLVAIGRSRSRRIKDIMIPHERPKVCTLREFRDGGGVKRGTKADVDEISNFLMTLAANVEALVQARKFETLSGRFAMMAFAFALGIEYVTGNSVFKGIDYQRLGEVAALCAIATVSAGSFAIAWGAKAQISVFMTKGYQNLVDSTLDNIVDGFFYDDLKL